MARTAAPGTRQRVLETASRLFYARGVRGVGMQEIIDTVGIGKNLLYREFPTKADLVHAYLEQAQEDWDRRVSVASPGPDADAAAQLLAIIQAMANHVHDSLYRGCPFRNYLAEFGGEDDPGCAFSLAYLRDTRAQIDALAAQHKPGDPGLAERIWVIVEGLYGAAGHPESARIVDVAASLAKEIIGGHV
ncbi:TetR/AcrR family transcriptional regulator [Streptomyces solisilvae]|uniref:TetR/AcrR family transcriptional regulator n=1 Tax=Streptomyces malaysiensis TaxID=92644 RepID=UPI0036936108